MSSQSRQGYYIVRLDGNYFVQMPIEMNLLRVADNDVSVQRKIIEAYFKHARDKYLRSSESSGAEVFTCTDPTEIQWSQLDICFLYRNGARFEIT